MVACTLFFCYSIIHITFAFANPTIMKRYFLLLSGMILCSIFLFSGCNSKTDEQSCSNKGNLWIVNKLDSTVIVTVLPVHDQFTMKKNDEKLLSLTASQSYTINLVYTGYNKDSIFLINTCDNKIYVLQ
jgi:uncharacterized lipoprotein YajG